MPRSVCLIEPFGVGGGPDIVARVLVEPLSACWGRSVVVENHPGGGSTAAPAIVANAPGDGNTLLVNTSAHAYSAAVAGHLPYDPLRDSSPSRRSPARPMYSSPVSTQGSAPCQISLPQLGRSPGAMTFGSTGVGTGTHLGTEELNLAAQIRARHVPAVPRSISDVVANIMQGSIDYVMLPTSIAASYLEEGALVALGVTTARRSPALPDTPTVAEAGVAGYDFPIWYGVWAPAGTSPKILDRLARDITAVISQPDVHAWLVTHGMEPCRLSPAAFARFVFEETQRAARIMNVAGVRRRS